MAVVPFRMSGVRLRGTPAVPWFAKFPELNVRTYVVRDDKPGVWFFSLDAANFVAVEIARLWFHLSYFHASMHATERDGSIHYRSLRTHRNSPPAALNAKYRPLAPPQPAQVGTLDHFLTERYCLYTAGGRGRLFRGEIHHPPWPLQIAEAVFIESTMASAAGIRVPENKPLLHFAKRQDVVAWPPQKIKS